MQLCSRLQLAKTRFFLPSKWEWKIFHLSLARWSTVVSKQQKAQIMFKNIFQQYVNNISIIFLSTTFLSLARWSTVVVGGNNIFNNIYSRWSASSSRRHKLCSTIFSHSVVKENQWRHLQGGTLARRDKKKRTSLYNIKQM